MTEDKKNRKPSAKMRPKQKEKKGKNPTVLQCEKCVRDRKWGNVKKESVGSPFFGCIMRNAIKKKF